MKKVLLLILVIIFSCVLTVFLHSNKKITFVSPILLNSKINLADNVWLPDQFKNVLGDYIKPPDNISAKAAFFVDTNTGEVLYEKNPQERLPIASLTKIMTVIVTMENEKMDDTVVVSSQAASMEPDKMYLKEGERLKVEELLDGVFLISANDAAEALAESVSGDSSNFVSLMNKEAQQIGMKNTHFINPTGLEEDGQTQYSSAYDVALMARYAIKHWPNLVDISSQPFLDLPQTDTHQEYSLTSGINLLTTYPGVVGFKTGYTPEAGLTLVTLARKGNHEVLGVILNADDRREEARALLDYSFKKLGVN